MHLYDENTDVVVIGAGHAGCEAALACARIGLRTMIFAISIDSVAMMPCNPNIGGNSKGHLVREIDALGGEMGKNIDKTYIQSRMLNASKGPAVYSLRAQADKRKYSNEMKKTLENTEGLTLHQGEVVDILTENGKVTGIISESDIVYRCKAVIISTGTYMNARCLYGDTIIQSGPNGLRGSNNFSECLTRLGICLFRFKTGTPARIDKRTIDFSSIQIQPGDERVVPFSFENEALPLTREQIPCYLTYTNEETHKIIRENIHRSPMYSGVIEGTGTRYCPSIEDKIVRFPDKERHQVFIEPEGEDTNEMYIQGMSSSLPEDVQVRMYRTVPGLEKASIIRPAYAIEYDCIDATQLKLNLEFKNIEGLFAGGQINGSSGYEEAAAQGLVAGINAACYIKGREPFILDRSQAYIGVLIDDLVTKGSKEPYRMMTSRAEYRLLLRQDNADLRLTEMGYAAGLISDNRYAALLNKKEMIEKEINRIESKIISPSVSVNTFLNEMCSTVIISGVKLSELMKRPELDYDKLARLDCDRPDLPGYVTEQVNISIKYQGYIKRQMLQVEQFKKMENKKLDKNIDYNAIKGLRLEARQKLTQIRPSNIGQASRITGVSPADISVLLICCT